MFLGGAGGTNDGKTTISLLCRQYHPINGLAQFVQTPSAFAGDIVILPAVNGLVNFIVGYLKSLPKCKHEPVDIFGFSRGAVYAITLAVLLDEFGIPIRFLGLLDPVRRKITDVTQPPKPLVVPQRGKKWLGDKKPPGTEDRKFEKDNPVPTAPVLGVVPNYYSLEKTQLANHFAMNDPAKGKRPMNELKFSAQVAGVVWTVPVTLF
jgi:hypothetical protein